jgi:hypothetical protein
MHFRDLENQSRLGKPEILFRSVPFLLIHLSSFTMLAGKPCQPSLMFSSKAGAYLNGAPFRCYTLGLAPGLTRNQLDKAGQACQLQININKL